MHIFLGGGDERKKERSTRIINVHGCPLFTDDADVMLHQKKHLKTTRG